METTSQSSAKLIEIQALAKSYDQKLHQEFGDNVLGAGGTLFLGKYYANSDKIFFGLNPGTWKAEDRKQFEWWLQDANCPWGHPDSVFRYWENCSYFFDKSTPLRDWIEDATSTFLIPWASPSLSKLWKNPKLAQRIYEYSGALVRKIIEHHQAKWLVVAGVTTLRTLASPYFLNFPLDDQTVVFYFPGTGYRPARNYQWHKVLYQHLVIYQVPHFSRANNKLALDTCALWLGKDILG